METATPTRVEDAVLDAVQDFEWLRGQRAQLENELQDCLEKVGGLETRRERIALRRSDIISRIGQVDDRDVQAAERNRRKIDSKRQVLAARIDRTRRSRDEHDAELDRIANRIERAKVTDRAHAKSREAMTLARKAAKALSELHELAAQELREEIESACQEIFSQLVWKDTQFTEVRLGTDYQLDVMDRYGMPARTEMSAGERQLLSLAFIAAMSRTAAKRTPFVIDTPLGRISGEPRRNIARQLPHLADQVVLFVTDTEYDGPVRRIIDPFVGQTYEICFDDETGTTELIEREL